MKTSRVTDIQGIVTCKFQVNGAKTFFSRSCDSVHMYTSLGTGLLIYKDQERKVIVIPPSAFM